MLRRVALRISLEKNSLRFREVPHWIFLVIDQLTLPQVQQNSAVSLLFVRRRIRLICNLDTTRQVGERLVA